MSDSYIATLLSRPDLTDVTGPLSDPYGGSSGGMAAAMPGAIVTAGSSALGQAHLGVIALSVLALVAFYAWTRSHQK